MYKTSDLFSVEGIQELFYLCQWRKEDATSFLIHMKILETLVYMQARGRSNICK